MNIKVYLPTDKQDIESLQEEITKIHAQAIVDYLKKLDCPTSQKISLLKDIIKDLKDNYRL